MRIGIIGGTGVYDPGMLEEAAEREVRTRAGTVRVWAGTFRGRTVVFVPRHGREHDVPPHRVNYLANVLALKEAGVERVVATAATGAIDEGLVPGALVVVDDFLDFTKQRTPTAHEGVVHTDMSEPYCPEVRAAILQAARSTGISARDGGCYVCAEGPRYETPAEIRMFRRLGGDLVGMTAVPETVLARELGLCYGLVAVVTNYAAGVSPEPLSHREVVEQMAGSARTLRALLAEVVLRIPRERRCRCGAFPA